MRLGLFVSCLALVGFAATRALATITAAHGPSIQAKYAKAPKKVLDPSIKQIWLHVSSRNFGITISAARGAAVSADWVRSSSLAWDMENLLAQREFRIRR